MVLTLGCANKLVCCCSSVNYSWHLLLLSCRAAKIWQFCNPCLQAIHKPHSTSTLKVQQCGCCQKPATCFLLFSVGFRRVEEETLLMSLVMVSRGSNWEQVHTTEWVRCVNTAGRWEFSLSLMVLARSKQVILHISALLCLRGFTSWLYWCTFRQLDLSPSSLATRRILTELLLCIMENWFWSWW